jgi:AcrR family transcriptional regulator
MTPPRPTATTDDESARHFLDAAAQLIDAMFVTSIEERPRRLRKIGFPVTLEWLRIGDVIKLASGEKSEGASRRAFHNRWKTKEAFIKDAIKHTMLYRDHPNANPALQRAEMAKLAEAENLAEAVAKFSDSMLESLLSYPRSFLLLHIGPLLDLHPDVKRAIVDDMLASIAPWYDGYAQLFAAFGVPMRPGWTIERLGLTLQSMLDGFLMRSRVQSEQMTACKSGDINLFGEAVVAFILGVLDADRTGQSVVEAFNSAVRTPPRGN